MYEYIEGILKEVYPLYVVLDINGIGYQIFVPVNSYNSLPQINEKLKCFISLIIKEDSHTLFGFLKRKEKDLFQNLIAVSGIGPKTALALIGHIDYNNFCDAIFNKNAKLISKVPGIGKKTAERLIIEMTDKISVVENSLNLKTKNKSNYSTSFSDALNALINLGYSHLKAQNAINKIMQKENDLQDVGQIISRALKII